MYIDVDYLRHDVMVSTVCNSICIFCVRSNMCDNNSSVVMVNMS